MPTMRMNKAVLALLAIMASGFATASLSSPAAADNNGNTNQVAPGYEQQGNNAHREGDHIEGHIAFLKAELSITPAQEALWEKVTAAMRADVAEYQTAVQQYSGRTSAEPTAIQDLMERATFTALRAQSERRFLDAFRPLYESLSASQKQAADDLFGEREER